MDPATLLLLLVFLTGLLAGVMNAMAGGGSFVTLPALVMAGLDPRAANITSTVALFPGQLTTAWVGRRLVEGAAGLSFRALLGISLAGGAAGALLLLATPSRIFAALVPWLVLFATAVFAWGSFGRHPAAEGRRMPRWRVATAQAAIGTYGGYFGGGIGFLMMAWMTIAGQGTRAAVATKNTLAAAMNASAVAVFALSPEVDWRQALVLGLGSMLGGWLGGQALKRVPEKPLRLGIVATGALLSIWLFVRG
jgi:uncharacterized membrane protein YfcA